MSSAALAELLKLLKARKNVPDEVYDAAICEAEGNGKADKPADKPAAKSRYA